MTDEDTKLCANLASFLDAGDNDSAIARIRALSAENENLRKQDSFHLAIGMMRAQAKIDKLEAIAAQLAEMLGECADDIEAEVEAKRGTVLERTTERDLAPVRKARQALAVYTAHLIDG